MELETQPLNFPVNEEPRRSSNPGAGKLWMLVVGIVSLALTCLLLATVLMGNSDPGKSPESNPVNLALMDRYDMYMTNAVSKALDGVLSIKKIYWLSDDDLVAPEPDQSCFGETDDPSTLGWLFEEAADLLEGQDTLFTLDTPIIPGTKVKYYLDETILVITWKQLLDYEVYTISEVKIADASQFRRFLAGGEYGSDKQFTTTEMAASVNAVVASSGDFYKFRRYGTIVYDGVVQRVDSWQVDTCFINDEGDLLFNYAAEIVNVEDAQRFVDENGVRFSVCFGPILIDDGKQVPIYDYPLGEIEDDFPRAGLGQRDKLHYILCTVNAEYGFPNTPSIYGFSNVVKNFGCDKFYTLDGGQTAVIAMNDQLINNVLFGFQRKISDIIYFATAVPDGG